MLHGPPLIVGVLPTAIAHDLRTYVGVELIVIFSLMLPIS